VSGPHPPVDASLRVRAATTADAAAVRDVYAPLVEETAVSFETTPPTAEEMARRMLAGERRLPWLVACRRDRVVGYAYAAPHRARAAYRWSVETSVYVADHARGGGVGRRLYDALLPLLAGLGYVSAYAGIALPNDGSITLHEAVGFRAVGTFPRVGFKHGRWHDTGWWWRPLSDAVAHPTEPRAWDGSDPA
jgi:phosphinothricin acetyltransferase